LRYRLLTENAEILRRIHPIMGPGMGSDMYPYAFYRQSTATDLGAMAQGGGAKYLMLTHLIPSLGADEHYPFKVPGRTLTETDYRKAVQDGGFTGTIIVGTGQPASSREVSKLSDALNSVRGPSR
jgi:hypothetical protein